MSAKDAAFPSTAVVAMLIALEAPPVFLLAFGVEVWWVDAFAHFLPWLTLALLIQAALLRHRVLSSFSIAAAGVLTGLMLTAPTAEMAGRPMARCEGPPFRVIGFNVQYGSQDSVAIAQWLDAQQPDLAFFMEVTPAWDAVLRQAAAAQGLAYRSDPDPGLYGSALMSRLPLVDIAFVPHRRSLAKPQLVFDSRDRAVPPPEAPQLRAVVRIGGDLVAVGGAHLSFPLIPTTHAMALEEIDQIAAWTNDRMNDPTVAGVLLLGDFNSTHFSAILRRLKATTGLHSVIPVWPGTWPANLPIGIAIDHVVVSGRLRARSVAVGDDLGSDHRPVSADIVIELATCPDA